eukprot:g78243.t1
MAEFFGTHTTAYDSNWDNKGVHTPLLPKQERGRQESPLRRSLRRYATRASEGLGEAGSIRSSTFTLITSIIGAGVLGLPYAFKLTGLPVALFLTFGCCALSTFSVRVLVKACGYANVMSYQDLSYRGFGRPTARFTQGVMCANLFGTTIAYMTVVVQLAPKAVRLLTGHTGFFTLPWPVLLLIVVFLVTPLSFQKDLSILRYSSLLAFVCSFYLTVVIMMKFNKLGSKSFLLEVTSRKVLVGELSLYNFFKACPIFIYAYTCHPNVLPVYFELKRPSQERITRVAGYALWTCSLLYMLIGMYVFITFEEKTAGNYLTNDFHGDIFILIGILGFSLSVLLAIPLFVHAARINLVFVMFGIYVNIWTYCIQLLLAIPLFVHAARINLGTLFVNREDVHSNPFLRYGLTILWLASTSYIAISVARIQPVLGLLGSTTNPTICFILPFCYLLKFAPDKEAPLEKHLIKILLPIVLAVTCCCLAIQFQSWSPAAKSAFAGLRSPAAKSAFAGLRWLSRTRNQNLGFFLVRLQRERTDDRVCLNTLYCFFFTSDFHITIIFECKYWI